MNRCGFVVSGVADDIRMKNSQRFLFALASGAIRKSSHARPGTVPVYGVLVVTGGDAETFCAGLSYGVTPGTGPSALLVFLEFFRIACFS